MFVRMISAVTFSHCACRARACDARYGTTQDVVFSGPNRYAGAQGEFLASHNAARRQAAVGALVWDPALAEDAQIHANELARLNLLRHSPRATRPGQGKTSGWAHATTSDLHEW